MIERAKQLQKAGLPPLPAVDKAMSQILAEQAQIISIPKRFSLVIREIWLLQYRFPKRQGTRPFNLLQHPRFRAAYDFMALRALAGDESMELAQWWTAFQEVDETKQNEMIQQAGQNTTPRTKRKRKNK
jgi:poly(A) polymerase